MKKAVSIVCVTILLFTMTSCQMWEAFRKSEETEISAPDIKVPEASGAGSVPKATALNPSPKDGRISFTIPKEVFELENGPDDITDEIRMGMYGIMFEDTGADVSITDTGDIAVSMQESEYTHMLAVFTDAISAPPDNVKYNKDLSKCVITAEADSDFITEIGTACLPPLMFKLMNGAEDYGVEYSVAGTDGTVHDKGVYPGGMLGSMLLMAYSFSLMEEVDWGDIDVSDDIELGDGVTLITGGEQTSSGDIELGDGVTLITETVPPSDSASEPGTSDGGSSGSIGEPFMFDGFLMTLDSNYIWGKINDSWSAHNNQPVVRIPVTITNKSGKSGKPSSFLYKLFKPDGTGMEHLGFDIQTNDELDNMSAIRDGATAQAYISILYVGDGEYYIEFDDFDNRHEFSILIEK